MQAAKIKIGDSYAIMHNGSLSMFKVTSVTTTRTGAHPSDFTHKITGFVDESTVAQTVGPDAVLGPYQEHRELLQKQQQAEAERARIKRQGEEEALDLSRLFYSLTGQSVPNSLNTWTAPFRAEIGGVKVNPEGVKLLLAVLSKRED